MTDGGCKLTKSQFNHFEEPLIEWGDIKSLLSSEKAKAKEQWKKEVLEIAPLKQDRNMSMFTNPVFYDGYNRAIEDYKKIIENY